MIFFLASRKVSIIGVKRKIIYISFCVLLPERKKKKVKQKAMKNKKLYFGEHEAGVEKEKGLKDFFKTNFSSFSGPIF